MCISLFVNLGMLFYFKYGTFFLDNYTYLLNLIGIQFQPLESSIILPVGISFYTFQTLSYTIDIFMKKSKPCPYFIDYALFVTFFPQLIAGPIVRPSQFIPQCRVPRKGSAKQLNWGISLFIIGLFLKVTIADALMAPIVEKVYNIDHLATFTSAWAGTLAFAIQIYCDFFGYSTCAIGLAMCLGFALPDNFRFPYSAVGFSDFWHRWHISLSTWLRDYLYIPLGGNRKGNLVTYINIMFTMFLGGLWHGASWMFVIWGGLHGIYIVIEKMLTNLSLAKLPFWNKKSIRLLLSLITFSLVCVTWVFFRAGNIKQAFSIVTAMFGFVLSSDKSELITLGPVAYFIAGSISVMALLFDHLLSNSNFEELAGKIPWWGRSIFISLMAFLVIISMTGEYRAFIYFQF